MPLPSVEPMPPVPRLDRLTVPLDAHEASYLAASERMASLRERVSWGIFVHVLFAHTLPSDIPDSNTL